LKRTTHAWCLALCVATLSACSSSIQPPPPKGTSKLVVRKLLSSEELEERRYGAYSYLLLPREAASDPRYVEFLSAYLTLPPMQENLQKSSASSQRLNVTYLPVVPSPPGKQTVDWLVQNYDVTRAAQLLHDRCLHDVGPYIITTKEPLSFEAPESCDKPRRLKVAVFDLSAAPRESVQAWLNHFVRTSEAPEDWSRLTAESMLLKLHDTLSLAGGVIGTTTLAFAPNRASLKVVSAATQ